MMRAAHASERIERIDPGTGIKVVQVTSYPSPASHLNYDWPSIAPDNGRLLIYVQRWLQRNAPWDIFRVDTDGLGLFQLTEHDEGALPGAYDGHNRPTAALSLDGKTVYVVFYATPRLYAVDVETGKEETVASLKPFCEPGATFQHMQLSPSEDRIYVVLRSPSIRTLRVSLRSGAVEEVSLDGLLFGCSRTEPRLVVMRNAAIPKDRKPDYVTFASGGGDRTLWNTDVNGGDARFVCAWDFAHATLLGATTRVQGCGYPPERCVWVAGEGEAPKRIAQGPYFWHSGSSYDGEWIIADTNWPDCGLQLLHVPTGHFRMLCQTGATLAHADYGHPHPALSQDGQVAVFRSDRTGVGQVYVAHISEEFRESVKAGQLDRPRQVWM